MRISWFTTYITVQFQQQYFFLTEGATKLKDSDLWLNNCPCHPSHRKGQCVRLRYICSEKSDKIFRTLKNLECSFSEEELQRTRRWRVEMNPASICLFKINNRNTRKRCEICSELTIKTHERRQWRCSVVFIVNFEHIWFLFLMFLLTLNK